jgi:hypothetical protein
VTCEPIKEAAIRGHGRSNLSRKDAANPLILRTIYWNAHKAFLILPRGAIAPKTGQIAQGGDQTVRSQELGLEVGDAARKLGNPLADTQLDRQTHR